MSAVVSNKSLYCMHNQEAERMNAHSHCTVYFYVVHERVFSNTQGGHSPHELNFSENIPIVKLRDVFQRRF